MRKLLALVAVPVLLTGCVFQGGSLSQIGIEPISVEPLKSSEYSVLGNVTGEASRESFLIFGMFEGCSVKPFCADDPAETAYFNAVQSVPQADALIAPRSKINRFSIPGIYSKTTVTISGKAIQLKPRG